MYCECYSVISSGYFNRYYSSTLKNLAEYNRIKINPHASLMVIL